MRPHRARKRSLRTPRRAAAIFQAIDITEEHVSNVAQRLYEAGASVFFHIDNETSAEAGNTQSASVETPAAAPPRTRTPRRRPRRKKASNSVTPVSRGES
jgi:hypothetical protein